MNYRYAKIITVFSKQHHWEGIYRIAADYGIVAEGNYEAFERIINRMHIDNLPSPVTSQVLRRLDVGVYAKHFCEWTAEGLNEKQRLVYEDIKSCADAFKQIVENELKENL